MTAREFLEKVINKDKMLIEINYEGTDYDWDDESDCLLDNELVDTKIDTWGEMGCQEMQWVILKVKGDIKPKEKPVKEEETDGSQGADDEQYNHLNKMMNDIHQQIKEIMVDYKIGDYSED